jgi:alpha-mannosidase
VLDAESDALRLEVRGVNTARDHRLRLRVATGLAGARVLADAAFGPVERRTLEVPAAEQRAERLVRTAPLHRYVSRYAADHGATVFSDGLAEYEACDDGAVVVTLVRAVGELSRPTCPSAPATRAGPPRRPRRRAPARSRPGSRWRSTAATPRRRAPRWSARPTTCSSRSSARRGARCSTCRRRAAGFELRGEGLAFGAVAPSDDGAWVVLRCVNVTTRRSRASGRWRTRSRREARAARRDARRGAAGGGGRQGGAILGGGAGGGDGPRPLSARECAGPFDGSRPVVLRSTIE